MNDTDDDLYPRGVALRVLADDPTDDQPQPFTALLRGGWNLIAADKPSTATAASVWFVGYFMVAASNIAMPVLGQWILLVVGASATFLGIGIIGRYALIAATGHRLDPRETLRLDEHTIRYCVGAFLVTLTAFVVYTILFSIVFSRTPATGGLKAVLLILPLLIVIAGQFVPTNFALGDPTGRATAPSLRAVTQPRYLALGLTTLILLGVSMTIPLVGILLMPWAAANLAYARFHDPATKPATTRL